jgi:hypothetical protein
MMLCQMKRLCFGFMSMRVYELMMLCQMKRLCFDFMLMRVYELIMMCQRVGKASLY